MKLCGRVYYLWCVSLVGLFAPQSYVQVLAPPVNTCYECEEMLVANHKCKVKYYTNAGVTCSGRESYFEVHNMQSILQLRSVWQQACSWVSPLSCWTTCSRSFRHHILRSSSAWVSVQPCVSYVTWFEVDHSASWLVEQGSKNCSFTSCSSGSNATIVYIWPSHTEMRPIQLRSWPETTYDTYSTLFSIVLCMHSTLCV